MTLASIESVDDVSGSSAYTSRRDNDVMDVDDVDDDDVMTRSIMLRTCCTSSCDWCSHCSSSLPVPADSKTDPKFIRQIFYMKHKFGSSGQ